jgi:hypothetical protein
MTEIDDGKGGKVTVGLLGIARGADQVVRIEKLVAGCGSIASRG